MGMLSTLSRRWACGEAHAASAGTRAQLRSRALTAATRALRSAMTGTIVATGLVLVLNGYASSGTLVAANMILARMLAPFEQFAVATDPDLGAASARALILDAKNDRLGLPDDAEAW